MPLVDPQVRNSGLSPILEAIGRGKAGATRIERGIYSITHFSFDMLISRNGGNLQRDDEWGDGLWNDADEKLPEGLQECGCHGVHDSIEAFLDDFKEALEASPYSWCVSFTEIRKVDQPDDGGWRWHKWGDYLGKHDPQYEYLRDEPGIDGVVVFHIYQRNEQIKPTESWLS